MATVSNQLSKVYQNGSFGIFFGAGISQASGLPGWDKLLLELVTYCEANMNINKVKARELRRMVKDNKFLTVAEDLREFMGSELQKFIKDKFSDDKLIPSDTLKKIIQLKYKFIITTNYDTLIENAFVQVFAKMPNPLTYKDASTLNYNLLTGEQFILKAHGDARSAPNEIVLTEKDYRTIIYKQPGYQSVLHVLFSTCNILFLGASLQDPEIKLMLGYIHNIFHGGSPTHFALMDKKQLTSVEVERWRKDYNITIIPYDSKDNHKEVEEFVDKLLAI